MTYLLKQGAGNQQWVQLINESGKPTDISYLPTPHQVNLFKDKFRYTL
jgi:hypothetical protein